MSVAGRNSILVVLGACLIAAGCSVLSPQPDHSEFFILTPVADGSGAATLPATASSSWQLTLRVGPVSFPDYLRRLPVVTRVDPNRIEISDEKRWAEPLDKSFIRTLSENLAILLGTQQIEKYPWPLATKIDYQVEVDVQRFETTSDNQTQLDASWIVRDGRSEKILYASKTTAAASAGADETSASAAMSNDLGTLSKEIALHVTELGQHPTLSGSKTNSFPGFVFPVRASWTDGSD